MIMERGDFPQKTENMAVFSTVSVGSDKKPLKSPEDLEEISWINSPETLDFREIFDIIGLQYV